MFLCSTILQKPASYSTINVSFCSFPNSLFFQKWKCSCPLYHHTWYLLGHFYLVQSITPNPTHYNTYKCISTSNTATKTKFAPSLSEPDLNIYIYKKERHVSFANRPIILCTAPSGIAVHSTTL